MFFPARMSKVLIGVHRTHSAPLTTALHESGIVEILDIRSTAEETGLHLFSSPDKQETARIIGAEILISQLIEAGEPFACDEERSLASWIIPPRTEKIEQFEGDCAALCQEAEQIVTDAAEILNTAEEIASLNERIGTLETGLDLLSLLSPFDLNPGEIGLSRFVETAVVQIPIKDLPSCTETITRTFEDELFFRTIEQGNLAVMCIITPASESRHLHDLLKNPAFRRIIPPSDLSGQPADLISSMNGERGELESSVQILTGKITGLTAVWFPRLLAMREELSLARERSETLRKVGSTRDVLFIEGWTRQADEDRLRRLVSESTKNEAFVQFKTPEDDENVPVRYDNPTWLRPFELLTTMYAPPRYGEIDPTPFFAPVFVLFFGLMLGDAGYGLIIVLVSFLLYRGIGQRDETMRDLCIILLACGIADVICGTIQGGWFGDMLPRFFNISAPLVLIDPMRSPIQFFQISLIIGLIHINLGLILGIWSRILKRQYRMAFLDHAVWFIIQPAAAVLLITFFGWTTFPGWIITLAGGVLAITCGMLFYLKGPMFFFSLTGFLGDWLSYVRILALALATGGIAMTINLLAQMIASAHPAMLIPAILFLIAGQAFNLVIQVLGSVIHALRLHYIEFFGKFYTGGGRPFLPFKARREYTMIKQEKGI